MLRFTKRADYGLMAIHFISAHGDDGAVSAKRIAEEFHIPPERLAKILQRLAKKQLITSHNGPKGGYVVADAKEGLLHLGRGVTTLATTADNLPFGFTDDVDNASLDANVYFTDASHKFGYGRHMTDLLEHGPNGRLLQYNVVDKTTRVLLRDLHFPNVVKQVAVKEMINTAPDPLVRETIVQNFEREANLLATLHHPSIPRIYDYFTVESRSYLVLEFIHGKDLEAIINETPGFLPENQVLSWAIELCDVLDYLHKHKPDPIIFRDMKPSNVMINHSGDVMLVDFGIAKTFQSGIKGTMIGTEGYSPPEQYRGELIYLKGYLRGLKKYEAIENDFFNPARIPSLYQGDLFTAESRPNPYIIVIPQIAEGMQMGVDLTENVTFAGYFLHLWVYKGGDNVDRAAPLLIGRLLTWTPAPRYHQVAQTGAFIAVAFVVLLMCVGGAIWALNRASAKRCQSASGASPAGDASAMAGLAQLEKLDIPDPWQSLKEQEQLGDRSAT